MSPQSPDHLMATFFSTCTVKHSTHQIPLFALQVSTENRALTPPHLFLAQISWLSLNDPCFLHLWLLVQIFYATRIATHGLETPVSQVTSLLGVSAGVDGARVCSDTLTLDSQCWLFFKPKIPVLPDPLILTPYSQLPLLTEVPPCFMVKPTQTVSSIHWLAIILPVQFVLGAQTGFLHNFSARLLKSKLRSKLRDHTERINLFQFVQKQRVLI